MIQPPEPDFNRDVHCILGLPFDAMTLMQAAEHVRRSVRRRLPCFFSTPNSNFLIAAQSDATFRDSVVNSELSLADGMTVVWLAKLLGVPIPERVAGSNLFEKLQKTDGQKVKVYFFGGPAGVAERAATKINTEALGMHCVGFDSPGFGSIEDMSSPEVLERINASQADFLVVSLGAKKGQAWIEKNRSQLNVPVVSHLGAVVNFVAGEIRRSPLWIQKIGMEWLWRVKEEPKLWRRYFDDAMALAGLLRVRVLPMMWRAFFKRTQYSSATPGLISSVDNEGMTILALSGAWTKNSLGPLRSAFRQVAEDKLGVKLDLLKVTDVDSAFLGLTMLLHGHQSRMGRRFQVIASSDEVSKVCHLSCVDFLLEIQS